MTDSPEILASGEAEAIAFMLGTLHMSPDEIDATMGTAHGGGATFLGDPDKGAYLLHLAEMPDGTDHWWVTPYDAAAEEEYGRREACASEPGGCEECEAWLNDHS